MREISLLDWINRPTNNKILSSFSVPKTPTQVKNELGVGKFNLKPFVKRRLIKCLNPQGQKGKLYVLTNKAKKLLNISIPAEKNPKDYPLIGWILASPKQRYVVLKALSLNSAKRTSDEIMQKVLNFNPSVTRISTKSILKELINKGLVETELTPTLRKVINGHPIYGKKLRRYYWINEKGKLLASNLH